CSDLRTAEESGFFDRHTAAAARCRHGIYAESTPGVETEIEAAPIVTTGDHSGRRGPFEGARIVSLVTLRDVAAGIWLRAYFLLYAEKETAARTVLRGEHADATAVSDLIDRIENVHDVEAHGHRLMIRHIEIARQADIELGVRRQRIDIGVAGAQSRTIDHVGREGRPVP